MKKLAIISVLLLFILLGAVSAQDNATCVSDEILGDYEKQDINVSIEVPEEIAKYSQSKQNNCFNLTGIPENLSEYNIYIDDEYYSNGFNRLPTGFEIDADKYSLGPHIIKANFTGNEQYHAFSVNKTFNIRNFEIIMPDELNFGYVNYIYAYMPGDATGTFEVLINNKLTNTWIRNYYSDDDQLNSFDVAGMNINLGENTLEWKYSGNSKYPGESKKKTVNGTYLYSWNYKYLIYGDTSPTYISLFPLFNITVEINGTVYPTYRCEEYEYFEAVKFYHGEIEPGNYTATITGYGENDYPSITIQQNITIVSVIKHDEAIHYNNNETYRLDIPEDANGNLSIYVEGKLFKTAPAKGHSSINLNGLGVGTYEVTANYTGRDYEVLEDKSAITVHPKVTYNSEIFYGDDELCYVEFEPDANYTVTYTFDNGENGIIELVDGKGNFSLSNITEGYRYFKIEYTDANYTNYFYKHITINDNADKPIDNLKSFKDAENEIACGSGNIIELEGNYIGNGKEIKIEREGVIIQGKNAILDAKSKSRIIAVYSSTTFKDLTFINGETRDNGGAIYSDCEYNKLTFINCTFINNHAQDGGAIFVLGNINIINCTFKYNSAEYISAISGFYGYTQELNVTGSYFISNYGSSTIACSYENIENSNFMNNTGYMINCYQTNIKNCNFTNNTKIILCEMAAIVENSSFTGNDYVSDEICIDAYTFKNCRFEKNICAILSYGNCKIINSTFFNNIQAIQLEPASDYWYPPYHLRNISIDNATFKSNIHSIKNTLNNLRISNCIFEDNSGYGAVIENYGGKVEINNSRFINNYKESIIISDENDSEYQSTGIITINNTEFRNDVLNDSCISIYPILHSYYLKSIMAYNGANTLKVHIDDKDLKGEKLTVKIGRQTFKVKINANGDVSFKIPNTVTPAKYTIFIQYKTTKITEKLTVKRILTLKTVKVKRSAKKVVLKATLNNKAISKKTSSNWDILPTAKQVKGKTITFKFNGKTYKAKTDSKGTAKVTIKFNVLKKLKAGKKVTYQATYIKDTVKKTVKIQK